LFLSFCSLRTKTNLLFFGKKKKRNKTSNTRKKRGEQKYPFLFFQKKKIRTKGRPETNLFSSEATTISSCFARKKRTKTRGRKGAKI